MSKYDFSFKQPKKTAKQTLFNIGVKTLKACKAPEQISFLGISYSITNKLREEVNKLSEETARAALEEIKKEISECQV